MVSHLGAGVGYQPGCLSSPPHGLSSSSRLGWLFIWCLRFQEGTGRSCKLSWGLHFGIYTTSLLPLSIGQRKSQGQYSLRGWGKRLYFSIGGIVKYRSYIFQFVEYFKVLTIMKMMRVVMILKVLSIYNKQCSKCSKCLQLTKEVWIGCCHHPQSIDKLRVKTGKELAQSITQI